MRRGLSEAQFYCGGCPRRYRVAVGGPGTGVRLRGVPGRHEQPSDFFSLVSSVSGSGGGRVALARCEEVTVLLAEKGGGPRRGRLGGPSGRAVERGLWIPGQRGRLAERAAARCSCPPVQFADPGECDVPVFFESRVQGCFGIVDLGAGAVHLGPGGGQRGGVLPGVAAEPGEGLHFGRPRSGLVVEAAEEFPRSCDQLLGCFLVTCVSPGQGFKRGGSSASSAWVRAWPAYAAACCAGPGVLAGGERSVDGPLGCGRVGVLGVLGSVCCMQRVSRAGAERGDKVAQRFEVLSLLVGLEPSQLADRPRNRASSPSITFSRAAMASRADFADSRADAAEVDRSLIAVMADSAAATASALAALATRA